MSMCLVIVKYQYEYDIVLLPEAECEDNKNNIMRVAGI